MTPLETITNITAPRALRKLRDGDRYTKQFYRLAADQNLAAVLELVSVLRDEHVDSLWISGGNSRRLDVCELELQVGLPTFFSPDGNFGGECGGMSFLKEKGISDNKGLVVDFGQTCLKISWAGRRWLFPRDLALLPKETGLESFDEADAAAEHLASFLNNSILTTIQEAASGVPHGTVWATAGSVSGEGMPLRSSYIGLAGNPFIFTDALEGAGIVNRPFWLLADTTLAALSARVDPRLTNAGFRETLVLTLGTSIGMAVIRWPSA